MSSAGWTSPRRTTPAARSYLELVFDEAEAKRCVKALRRAPRAEFKAKDILRASGLSKLGISNSHVERDRRKILAGRKLSPPLLVRMPKLGKVIVAFDEDLPDRLMPWPLTRGP